MIISNHLEELFGEALAANGKRVRDNFSHWFGESKVVDARGAPLVVHHGCPDVRGLFDNGFRGLSRGSVFFAAADYSVADSYADDRRAFDYQNAEPHTVALYLTIKDPMVIDAGHKHWRDTEKHVSLAKSAGHDGIIIRNSIDFYDNVIKRRTQSTTVYAWFDPLQAKSALDAPLRSRVDMILLKETGVNPGLFSCDDPSLVDRHALQKILDLERAAKALAMIASEESQTLFSERLFEASSGVRP